MDYIKTKIDGVYILEPKIFSDERGYFTETYRKADFDANIGLNVNFIQDNQSKSTKGVLRGLHFQKGVDSQAKLVRVIKGTVVDVAVDLRKSSPTFGQYVMVELSAENMRQLFIPRGFAHGFQVISDEAEFIYKVDNRYAPESEVTLAYNDPELKIKWPITAPEQIILSSKDINHAKLLNEIDTF